MEVAKYDPVLSKLVQRKGAFERFERVMVELGVKEVLPYFGLEVDLAWERHFQELAEKHKEEDDQ